MKRVLLTVALVGVTVFPALAALKPGSGAPLFSAPATLGGKEFTYDLADELRKGPVVLYFYPEAFTSGCTVEAHEFAEHMKDFQALGASVIGVSGDDINKLNKFSVSECRSKFPVAADANLKIAKSYDATLLNAYANRVSYVIAQNGKVAYVYSSLDPDKHVANTLEALKRLENK
jgi:peroxiredoxin